jgi:hypothetical protein
MPRHICAASGFACLFVVWFIFPLYVVKLQCKYLPANINVSYDLYALVGGESKGASSA